MDSNEFVYALKKVVELSAISDVGKNLGDLSITPSDSNSDSKSWYIELDDGGKECVNQIIEDSIRTAIFGVLCVLDGVRAIEDTMDKGSLELYFVRDDEKVLLNDFNEDFLHDIYKSME
ncbi:MAG: hypothetical protein ABWZ25_15160 [Chitinophagaceae bacterium]